MSVPDRPDIPGHAEAKRHCFVLQDFSSWRATSSCCGVGALAPAHSSQFSGCVRQLNVSPGLLLCMHRAAWGRFWLHCRKQKLLRLQVCGGGAQRLGAQVMYGRIHNLVPAASRPWGGGGSWAGRGARRGPRRHGAASSGGWWSRMGRRGRARRGRCGAGRGGKKVSFKQWGTPPWPPTPDFDALLATPQGQAVIAHPGRARRSKRLDVWNCGKLQPMPVPLGEPHHQPGLH